LYGVEGFFQLLFEFRRCIWHWASSP
jgi:hypothetical protein